MDDELVWTHGRNYVRIKIVQDGAVFYAGLEYYYTHARGETVRGYRGFAPYPKFGVYNSRGAAVAEMVANVRRNHPNITAELNDWLSGLLQPVMF